MFRGSAIMCQDTFNGAGLSKKANRAQCLNSRHTCFAKDSLDFIAELVEGVHVARSRPLYFARPRSIFCNQAEMIFPSPSAQLSFARASQCQ